MLAPHLNSSASFQALRVKCAAGTCHWAHGQRGLDSALTRSLCPHQARLAWMWQQDARPAGGIAGNMTLPLMRPSLPLSRSY
jgi:hypothetical protein